MTKVIITASIDAKLASKLDDFDNASFHVNEALKRYFNSFGTSDTEYIKLTTEAQELAKSIDADGVDVEEFYHLLEERGFLKRYRKYGRLDDIADAQRLLKLWTKAEIISGVRKG